MTITHDFRGLHTQVCFDPDNRKIIWQPRIGCWYDDKLFAGEALPEPYTGMSIHEVYRELDCSARLYDFNGCFERIEDPRVALVHESLNETDTQTTIETPAGKQVYVRRRSPNNPYHVTLKWEVTTAAELRVAIWREENSTWKWHPDLYDRLLRDLGDLGAPAIFMPRMNIEALYLEKMGVENAILAIHDWSDAVEAFFRARDASHEPLIDLVSASPIDIVNFGENVHSDTLSPALFRKYHLPTCQHRCERLHAAGKFVYSHWDGSTKPLLPLARETGLDGIEAITPEPQGDVTLEEIKEGLGDDMFLLDGLPAVYFDETFSVDTLLDCTHRLIELFAPKLILGISDEISSTGQIERVRLVGEIVDAYNRQFD